MSSDSTAADSAPRTLVLLALGVAACLLHLLPPPFFSSARSVAFLPQAVPRQEIPGPPGVAAVRQQGRGATSPTTPAQQALFTFSPIPINRADAELLATVDGIGPVLAGRIVEWRTTHGPFRSADDLLAVRGIGPKKLAGIMPQITFD